MARRKTNVKPPAKTSGKKKQPTKTAAKAASPRTAPVKRKSEELDEAVDFNGMTVAQLRKECEKMGVETTGKKAQLVKRLNGTSDADILAPTAKVPKLEKQSTLQKAAAAVVASGSGKRKTFKPDAQCPIATGSQVYQDFDCMLNKTDIKANNNKYYLIQVLTKGAKFYAWNRWGRVGDPPGCFHGQKLHGPFNSAEGAVKSFEQKFWDKSRTKWADKGDYKAVKGKYNLIEMGEDDDDDEQVVTVGDRVEVTSACTLDSATQALVKFIFDKDMFNKAMVKLSFDVKKMPLGKISKAQIAKGFSILDEIRDAIDSSKSKKSSKLSELSSAFYTAIPHDFGWKRPSIIDSRDEVREKMDNLLILADIELAQSLQKNRQLVEKAKKKGDLPPHPLDQTYKMLQCELELIEHSEDDFKVIEKYLESTKGSQVKKVKNVWRMNRLAEGARFGQHAKVGNRRLLWHGTNVAVVAAILKDGLRIMPHAGGRVGRGLYFASENSKSAAYVGSVDRVGMMFLNEVALGKEYTLTNDDSSLTKPPAGCDSVVARGWTEPDPKRDTSLTLDGKTVAVPQGKPLQTEFKNKSSFDQSEYLVYQESQVRMRYLLQFEWTW